MCLVTETGSGLTSLIILYFSIEHSSVGRWIGYDILVAERTTIHFFWPAFDEQLLLKRTRLLWVTGLSAILSSKPISQPKSVEHSTKHSRPCKIHKDEKIASNWHPRLNLRTHSNRPGCWASGQEVATYIGSCIGILTSSLLTGIRPFAVNYSIFVVTVTITRCLICLSPQRDIDFDDPYSCYGGTFASGLLEGPYVAI